MNTPRGWPGPPVTIWVPPFPRVSIHRSAPEPGTQVIWQAWPGDSRVTARVARSTTATPPYWRLRTVTASRAPSGESSGVSMPPSMPAVVGPSRRTDSRPAPAPSSSSRITWSPRRKVIASPRGAHWGEYPFRASSRSPLPSTFMTYTSQAVGSRGLT